MATEKSERKRISKNKQVTSDGASKNTRFKNKHQKRMRKPYRGQGK